MFASTAPSPSSLSARGAALFAAGLLAPAADSRPPSLSARGAALFAAGLLAPAADSRPPSARANLPGAFFSAISVSLLVACRRRATKAQQPWAAWLGEPFSVVESDQRVRSVLDGL